MSNIEKLEQEILSPLKIRFCQEYIKDGNAQRSAIAAGYSVKSASAIGSKILKDGRIRAYISELMAEGRKQSIVTYEEISSILSAYIRREMVDPAVDVKGNVHNVPVHSREIAKLADVYSKIHGWQTDNLHLQSDNTVQFVDDIADVKSKAKKQSRE